MTDQIGKTERPRVLMIDPMIYKEMALAVREDLERDFDVTYLWMQDDKDTYLDRHGAEFRGFLSRTGITPAILDKLPNLEIVTQTGAGIDHVPVDYIHGRGIALTNTRGSLSDDVADIAIGLMLMTARELGKGERMVRAGQWPTTRSALTRSANRRRYGILGMGSIGSTIARRLSGFGGTIGYHNRRPVEGSEHQYFDNLVEMAENSDFLFVAVPGGASTNNIVDEKVLRALGPDGIVVNIGRGASIDEEALIRVLAEGALGGAGLDVHLNEPHINPAFMEMENVVLLPHLGSTTIVARTAQHRCCVDNLQAYFGNRPLLTPILPKGAK